MLILSVVVRRQGAVVGALLPLPQGVANLGFGDDLIEQPMKLAGDLLGFAVLAGAGEGC